MSRRMLLVGRGPHDDSFPPPLPADSGERAASSFVRALRARAAREAAGDAVPIHFSSAWGTGTGNSDQATSDGGKWDTFYCWEGRPNVLSVVPGGPLGWERTPNVLAVRQTQECGNIEKLNTVPASTTHWGRFFFRNDENATGHLHPVTYNVSGTIQIAPWMRAGKTNGFDIGVGTSRYGNGISMEQLDVRRQWWIPALLTHGAWYRYEWMIEYINAISYRIWPRVYDMAGTLLYDASSYYHLDSQHQPNQTLAYFYEHELGPAGGTFGITNAELARNFGMGNEGPGGSSNTGGFWYHAQVALSLDGWIGDQATT